MRTRREFLSYGAGAAGVALLSACGSGAGSTSTPPAGGGKQVGGAFTYTIWTNADSNGVNLFHQATAAYNATAAQKVNFNVNTLVNAGADIWTPKLQSLISSGNTPDVFANWVGTLASPFISQGAVQPLTAWYEKYNWARILQPSAVKYVTSKGEPYGVPAGLFTVPVWYNKTLFAKAGVAPPTTYAEWASVNDKLAQSGVQPGVEAVLGGYDVMRLFEHLLEVTAGPALHDQLLNLTASWSQPAVAEAFGLFQEWGSKWLGKGFLGVNANDASIIFSAGKGAQSLQGGWEAQNLQAANANFGDFSIFVPPTQNGGKARLAGFTDQYQVSSQLKGEAFDVLGSFFNWYIQPANSRKYYYNGTATINGVPTNNPLTALADQITSTHEAYLIQDEALGTKLTNSYYSIQADVLSGSMTPKAAAAAMATAASKA